jgi:Spy/CpxP family protein refolding chaperone
MIYLAVIGALSVGTASAQPPAGPPPGGFPGGPRPGGPGGRPFDDALINVPLDALASSLKLTASQRTQIGKIQDDVHKRFAAMMGRPGGGPPNFEGMRANFEKIARMDSEGTAKIKALLTPAQKKALPAVLQASENMDVVGIPSALIGSLKLTGDQNRKIAAIATGARQQMRAAMSQSRGNMDFAAMRDAMMKRQKATHDKAMAVLNGTQRAKVEQYLKAHPRRGPGGFGPPPR